MQNHYKNQVNLLLRIIPEINKIKEFALHGGTAINLFYNNMPRLSVDIDLTYIPYSNRENDLNNIKLLLDKLEIRLKTIIQGIKISKPQNPNNEVKLFCNFNNSEVKIEVNTINRGIIGETISFSLCEKAQEQFNLFCEMKIVPVEQLFGGKMIAALDRQHPRDLFDTMQFLDTHTLNDSFIKGFLFCLFSSKRPIFEILSPNFLDYSNFIQSQFTGMTDVLFTQEMYKIERTRLINAILNNLTPLHKTIILNFAEINPTWTYGDWSKYPGIAWKLQNLDILKSARPEKFNIQLNKLKKILMTH